MSGASYSLAADLYVDSQRGSDKQNGSLEAPLRTIQAAADRAKPGVTIHLRAGVYREEVKAKLSGTKSRPIVIRAYQNEKAVLSAGNRILEWKPQGNDVWSAEVGKAATHNERLFVEGKEHYPARHFAENDWLDFDDWGEVQPGDIVANSDVFKARNLTGFGDDYWNGGKITYFFDDGATRTKTITDYDSKTGHITMDSPENVVYHNRGDRYGYFLSNCLAAMDKPGEWHRDGTTLFYRAEPGQDLNKIMIELTRRHFGFSFADSHHVTIEGIEFRGASAQSDDKSSHLTYRNNWFHSYAYPIALGGDHCRFVDNEVTQSLFETILVNGDRNSIVNNYFHELSTRSVGSTALRSSSSSDALLVSHNTFSRMARDFTGGSADDSEYCHNVFEKGSLLARDTGFFDSDGRGGNSSRSIIHHNVFRDTLSAKFPAIYGSWNNAMFHHNIIYGFDNLVVMARGYEFRNLYHNTIIYNFRDNRMDMDARLDPFAYIASSYKNNIQKYESEASIAGYALEGNHDYSESDFVDFQGSDFRLAAGSKAIDQGIRIPGINDNFAGSAPDAGAIESGKAMWKCGHDFSDPERSRAEYDWSPLPGLNLIPNALMLPVKDKLDPQWDRLNAIPVENKDFNSWNIRDYAAWTFFPRSGSVKFLPGAGIVKRNISLCPNTTYTVGAVARVGQQVSVGARYTGASGNVEKVTPRGEDCVAGIEPGGWVKYADIDFGDTGQFDLIELLYSKRKPGVPSVAELTIELRIDSENGPLLARFEEIVDQKDTIHFGKRALLSGVSGKHDVYVIVLGENSPELAVGQMRLLKETLQDDQKLAMEVRLSDGVRHCKAVGRMQWKSNYETIVFTTGPDVSTAEFIFENIGEIDCYLDRVFMVQGSYPNTDNIARVVENVSQSSTVGDNEAALAIDGDLSTFAETHAGRTGWWQIDLESNQSFGEIILRPPHSQTSEALGTYSVSIWTGSPDNGGKLLWKKSYSPPEIGNLHTERIINGSEVADADKTRLASVFGRVLRIEHDDQITSAPAGLILGEVEIRSTAVIQPHGNAALFGKAKQSTNSDNSFRLASDAIDGAIDPTVSDKFTSTQRGDPNPFWYVDLLESMSIDQIVIYNRLAAASRLGAFDVILFDKLPEDGGKVLWSKRYSYRGDTPTVSTTSIGPGGRLQIDGDTKDDEFGVMLNQRHQARYVGIRKQNTEFLSLVEVQVWSAPPDGKQPNPTGSNRHRYAGGDNARRSSGSFRAADQYAYDLQPFGSPLDPNCLQLTDRTSCGYVHWLRPRDGLSAKAVASGSELTDDFVIGDRPKVLIHKLKKGNYDVFFNMSGSDQAKDELEIRAEGQVRLSEIARAESNRNASYHFPVAVTDGALELEFSNRSSASSKWALNRLLVRRAKVTDTGRFLDRSCYRYDFGTESSPIQNMNAPVTENTKKGFARWTAGDGLKSFDAKKDSHDDAIRDFIGNDKPSRFSHQLKNAEYEVTLRFNDPLKVRDQIRVRAEGIVKVSGLSAGGELGIQTRTFTVQVDDGFLDLDFSDEGGNDSYWIINSVTIQRIRPGMKAE